MYRLRNAAFVSFLLASTQPVSPFIHPHLIQLPLGAAAHRPMQPANGTHSAVPGSSPFYYRSDPSHDLLHISRLDMEPNPCVMLVSQAPPSLPSFPTNGSPLAIDRESYCTLTAFGTFTKDIPSAHLSFNVTTHFDDGREGLVPGEDNLCNWAEVMQNDTKHCPPLKGDARLRWETILLGGWIPEVSR